MPTNTRRTDIDWLRIGAVYLLFFFHTAMVFNPAPFYHVRNGDVSIIVMIVAGFISLWHMPLLFLLAGWSVFSSLETRGPASFFKERVLKLFVPLVMCSALFGPPIKYVELRGGLDFGAHGLRVSQAQQESFASVIPGGLPVAEPFNERFLDFVPTFFSSLDRFTWSHLWFLAYLFTFTVLYYPVFRWIRRHAPRIGRVRSLWVFAPVVPLALIQVLLRPHWPGVQNLYDDWANFAYYSTYVLMGFLLACHPVLEDAIRRERKRALYVSLGAMVVLLLSVLRIVQSEPLLLACSAVAGWCFIVAVVGYGAGLRQRQTYSLDYLRESAFPIYLLHQPVIVLLGSAVVELSLGIPAKLALLLSGSIAVTLLLYHYVVRPVPILRVIHGMKPRRDPASRHDSHRAGAGLPRVTGLWLIGLAFGLGVAVAPGSVSVARASADPTGLWWAEGGAAQVKIHHCGQSLCGHVAWLRSPFDENGCHLRDHNNPEPAGRHREVLGARILAGLRAEGGKPATWSGGTIYDPGSGRTYRAHVTLTGDDRLAVRGYIGLRFIGRTTTWIRVGSERACRQHTAYAPGQMSDQPIDSIP